MILSSKDISLDFVVLLQTKLFTFCNHVGIRLECATRTDLQFLHEAFFEIEDI